MKSCLFSLILFGLVSGQLVLSPGLAKGDDSPEGVVREATAAFNVGRSDDFARAMHPEALRLFRSALTAIVEAADKDGKAGQVLVLFPKCKTVADLKKLDDTAFFAEYLQGVTSQNPELKKTLEGSKIQVIGRVDESPELTHVLYRTTVSLDGEKVETGPSVATVRKDGKRWAMTLTSDIDAMTVMMTQKAKGKAAFPDRKASKIQSIGRLLEKDETAQIVYRVTTPIGDQTLSKMNVLTVKKTDPGWKAVKDGNKAAIEKVLKQKVEL